MTDRIKIQNTLKVLSNFLISKLETTDEQLKAVEHLQQYLEDESIRIIKGRNSYDRCQYCGKQEGLHRCEYCTVVYCTQNCATKHDNKACISRAIQNIIDTSDR